ncbi:hypothetical protein [Ktedonospora formicarum]|uniref:Transcription regulator PadR C-terminal domain-containing protein n=1 Tax=Ktedonospora formicarum TaxID=2778364 RepID=A0A8J3MYG4_9CHLR|nr:hypothetical protein [Ktedonospora formicarum]GHO49625.1 hypothetical protein KSX_77880 [Ktedonospora formicarum]
MWQTICFCPPGMLEDERHHFLDLYGRYIQSGKHGAQEINQVDLGLSFLSLLTPDEALTVLQERRELITRSQEWLECQDQSNDVMHMLTLDHIGTMLEAERSWLERSIRHLRISALI